jgi:hypothetical protein
VRADALCVCPPLRVGAFASARVGDFPPLAAASKTTLGPCPGLLLGARRRGFFVHPRLGSPRFSWGPGRRLGRDGRPGPPVGRRGGRRVRIQLLAALCSSTVGRGSAAAAAAGHRRGRGGAPGGRGSAGRGRGLPWGGYATRGSRGHPLLSCVTAWGACSPRGPGG